MFVVFEKFQQQIFDLKQKSWEKVPNLLRSLRQWEKWALSRLIINFVTWTNLNDWFLSSDNNSHSSKRLISEIREFIQNMLSELRLSYPTIASPFNVDNLIFEFWFFFISEKHLLLSSWFYQYRRRYILHFPCSYFIQYVTMRDLRPVSLQIAICNVMIYEGFLYVKS